MPRRPVSINTRDRGLASVYRCSPGEQSCTASDNINLLCQLLAAWQAGTGTSSLAVARAAWAAGGARGLYSGGTATLAREVPFSLIQFPLLGGPEGAGVRGEGRAAGGTVAAALTNPMDVVKTRLMLQQAGRQEGVLAVLARVTASKGWRA